MVVLLILQMLASPAALPPGGSAPFFPLAGEVLTYDAKVQLLGRVGEATMEAQQACVSGSRKAMLVSFSVRGGAAFLRVADETRSWIDAGTGTTLKYEKKEASPLGNHEESVTVLPEAQRWMDAAGREFDMPGNRPIDELSLLYYIRTLPLVDGDRHLGANHFDARRNPVLLLVRGRTITDVPAGRFSTIDVELKVRDPRRYRGAGTIRVQLTDDHRRLPVRIRTSLPGSSTVTLELRDVHSPAATPAVMCR